MIVSPNCTDIKCQTGKRFSKKAVSVMVHTRPSFRNLKQGKKEAIDVRMSVVKPLSAKWMIRLYDYMRSNPDIIANGFSPAGITFDDRCLYVIIHKLKCVKCFSNYSCGKKVTRLSSKNWFLIFSVSSLAAVESVPKARAVALAIANKPLSQIVFHC